ncbi:MULTISPECIES: GAF domain-containing protein [Actinomadura]|nr:MULTISPECIES: GAF domain-containing protein [Actinomadura]MBB4778504.1 hypothetical protein [Actinomadura catellatispora]TDC68475.1 GAF domain-containing protein [Actinomadura sp. GC306]
MGWKYWRKVLGFFFISAASGAGLVAIGVYGEGFAKDDDKRLMYLVGGVLALTAVLGTFIENHMAERARARARERAIKAEAEMTLLYNNILLPSAQRMRDQVSKYVSDHPRTTPIDVASQQNFERFLEEILEGAVRLIAPPAPPNFHTRARASFYSRTAADDYELVKFSPVTAPSPRAKIEGAHPGGSHIKVDILDKDAIWVVDGTPPNISYLKPTSVNSYEAVIAAPVICNGRQFGVLSIDAPTAKDFIVEHRNLIRALADLIAASKLLTDN